MMLADITSALRRLLAERRARAWDMATGTLRPRELEESVALEAAITAVEEREQRRGAAAMRNLLRGY